MSFVYFIREDGPDGYIKIGCSDSPVHRLLSLQSGNPRKLRLLVAVEYVREIVSGRDRRSRFHESRYHRAFAHLRLNPDSEWFRPEPDLLDQIDLLISEGEPFIAPHATPGAIVVPLTGTAR